MIETNVSETTRREVWRLLVNLEHNVRYYGAIADRHLLEYRAIRFIMLVGLLGEGVILYFAATAQPLLWGVGVLLAFLLAILTVYDVVANRADSAAVLRLTSMSCDDLKTEAEQLWRRVESNRIDDFDAGTRCDQIIDRWARATQKAILEVHQGYNLEAAKEASKVLSDRYAS